MLLQHTGSEYRKPSYPRDGDTERQRQRCDCVRCVVNSLQLRRLRSPSIFQRHLKGPPCLSSHLLRYPLVHGPQHGVQRSWEGREKTCVRANQIAVLEVGGEEDYV